MGAMEVYYIDDAPAITTTLPESPSRIIVKKGAIMASINKTPHYNLSQFGDSPDDKPSWRGDYTADMSKIDSQMYRNETDATTAASTANTAKSTADNALSLAQTNKSDIAEQESYFTALGVTSSATAQSLMSTINGKAENTALTALRGTVSTLSDTVDTKANASEVYTRSQADARYTQQGGYAGTAQTLNADINKLKNDGVAPVQFMSASIDALGIKGTISGQYSPISHLATLRFDYRGTLTGNLPDVAHGGTKVATIPSGYRVTGQPISFFHDAQPLTNPSNGVGYMFFILGTDGSVSLAGAYQITSGNAIASTAIMAYYVL